MSIISHWSIIKPIRLSLIIHKARLDQSILLNKIKKKTNERWFFILDIAILNIK